jgi:ABC-type uncharacterized transport system permease subunit
MALALTWAALACYAAAAAGSLVYLRTRRLPLARLAHAVAAAGLAAHVAGYGAECAASRAMVVASAHGAFSLLTLCTVLVSLTLVVRHGLHILGAFVMPLAVAVMTVAAVSPAPPPPAALHGALFPLHVATSFLGLAALTAACGVAVAYLVQRRELKSRRPDQIAYALPPLDVLDRLTARLILLALAALGAGIATGVLFARQTSGAWWPGDPRSAAMLVSWLVFAAAAGLRAGAGWRGRRHALAVVGGFALVVAAFAGLSHLP